MFNNFTKAINTGTCNESATNNDEIIVMWAIYTQHFVPWHNN